MSETFELHLNTDNQLLSSVEPCKRVLEVRLVAPPSANPGKRQDLNLALVLDRSGSMSGQKLAYVKQAAEHVTELLSERDLISVVTFDDRIDLLQESAHLTPPVRQQLKDLLRVVRSGGSTDLFGGWAKGCQQVAAQQTAAQQTAAQQAERQQVSRVLLLTDGQANVGITDVEELSVHARELGQRGVSTSTFGVGEGFNEALLESMANNGGGNFTYIDSPMDIPDVFAREFKELLDLTARDVEVEVVFPEAVDMALLGSWKSEQPGRGIQRVWLGSLGAGQEKTVHIDLSFQPGAEGEQVPIQVTARGRSEGGEVLEATGTLTFTYSSREALEAAAIDEAVLQRAALARISTVTRQALELERKGQAEQAARVLHAALDLDGKHLGEDQRSTYEQMAQRMRTDMSERDRKVMHYQSYLHSKQRMDASFDARTQGGLRANQMLLDQLLQKRAVRVHPSPFLSSQPAPLPSNFSFDKIEGMLLGLAIGDALGNTSESMLPDARRGQFGEITDYLPNRHAEGRRVGLPSDDTQLSFWTLEHLLDGGYLDPEQLARRFTRERIFGIGATVREFIRAYKDEGRDWKRSGQESAGNGALMRIAPVLLPYLSQPGPGLWADAVLAGMLTHNDYASNAACVAFTAILWEMLGRDSAPRPGWWAVTYHQIAAALEGPTQYASRMPGSLPYRGPVAEFAKAEVGRALGSGWSIEKAGNAWGSGAYLLETMPTALYILARYASDPEQAILRAVNDTKDNDTVAAIVGAVVGALHGKAALPERWIRGLLGRTAANNDGHVFKLIEDARRRFG